MAVTLLIIDDHDAFRAAARRMLEAEGCAVIGEAATGEEAVTAAAHLHPDVVLLDIQLPDIDGFAVAETLADLSPVPEVVLISSRDAPTYGPRLATARARGFLSKRELNGATLAAILA